MPDHHVYGSVNSAYDSSRPGSHARYDQVPNMSPFPYQLSLPTGYSYRWKDRQSNIRGQRHLIRVMIGLLLQILFTVADCSILCVTLIFRQFPMISMRLKSTSIQVTPQDFATNAVGEYRVNWVKFFSFRPRRERGDNSMESIRGSTTPW